MTKLEIELAEGKITVQGSEPFVERIAVMFKTNTSSHLQGNPASSGAHEIAARSGALGERTLIDEKKPSGHHETVAVLAYSLRDQGLEEFTPDDIRRAYLRAGVRPPKVIAQAIRDAKNKFDFVESGAKPGTYRLSHHGERTVLFDLPRH